MSSPDASADEIRAAWKTGIADLDPTDRRFRVLNQAAEVLLDPASQERRTTKSSTATEQSRSDRPKLAVVAGGRPPQPRTSHR